MSGNFMVTQTKVKFFHPKRKIGYDSQESPEWNIHRGINYRNGQSYLRVYRQLDALAKVEKKNAPDAAKVFRQAVLIALKKHESYEK